MVLLRRNFLIIIIIINCDNKRDGVSRGCFSHGLLCASKACHRASGVEQFAAPKSALPFFNSTAHQLPVQPEIATDSTPSLSTIVDIVKDQVLGNCLCL